MNDRLLARYVTGASTAEEDRRVERWLAEADAHRERLRQIEEIWAHGRLEDSPAASGEAWRRLKARVPAASPRRRPMRERQAPGRRPEPRTPARGSRHATSAAGRVHPRRLLLAAVLLLAVAAVAYGLRGTGASPFGESASVAEDTVRTAPGQQKRLQLADGTAVRLAPGSALRFPASFSDTARAVYLQGQAFFEVARDTDRPFTVRAGGARVRVLGTAFGVDAYAADSNGVRVAVREGRVALAGAASDERPVVLGKAETGRLTADGRLTSRATTGAPLAWLDGRLAFRDAPLVQALRTLERWYAFDARLADPALADRRLTATFAGESLSEALEVLHLALHVRTERDGQTVTFYEASPH